MPLDVRVKRDRWGRDHLVWNDDVDVYIYEDDDGRPYVQVETNPETDSWKILRVFVNDGEAVEWE